LLRAVAGGINPALLVYPNRSDPNQKLVYSLWLKGKIHVANSAAGPWSVLQGVSYPNSPNANPAPIYHKGRFYMTAQHTDTVWTRQSLAAGPDHDADPEAGWEVFASISHDGLPAGVVPEDPFMYVDKRDRWHIINHAYNVNETTHCAASALSTHFFSEDGKAWHCSTVEPYGHVVSFDDGTNHTYRLRCMVTTISTPPGLTENCLRYAMPIRILVARGRYTTLERPNIHFDGAGRMTHLVLAADLVTGDEGCASRPWPRKGPGESKTAT
jgi:hypothetical protein